MTPDKNRAQAQSLLESNPLMQELMKDLVNYEAYMTMRVTNKTHILLTNGLSRKDGDVYTFHIALKPCQIDKEKTPEIEIKLGDVRKSLLLTAMLSNCVITQVTNHGDPGIIQRFKIYTKGEEVTGDEQVISFLELLGHVKRLMKLPEVDYVNGPTKAEA